MVYLYAVAAVSEDLLIGPRNFACVGSCISVHQEEADAILSEQIPDLGRFAHLQAHWFQTFNVGDLHTPRSQHVRIHCINV